LKEILFVGACELQVNLAAFVFRSSDERFRARYAMGRRVAHKDEWRICGCGTYGVFVGYVVDRHRERPIVAGFHARDAAIDRTLCWNPANINSHRSRLLIGHCAPGVIGIPLDLLPGLGETNERDANDYKQGDD